MNVSTAIAIGSLASALIAGLVALIKLKPEGDQILVNSAKDVVLIQKAALDDMRSQLDDLRGQLVEVRHQLGDVEDRSNSQLAAARRAQERAEADLAQEVARNRELTGRVAALEGEIVQLRKITGGG